MINIKEILVDKLLSILDKRIETANNDIKLAKESRDNETKSTAGDKYETGRSMVQFELEKNNVQLNKAIQLKNELAQIDLQKKFKSVEFGCLVFTNKGNYFISIGLGKIEISNESIYCISLASPIGKIFHHKKVNDQIVFQEKEIEIFEIF